MMPLSFRKSGVFGRASVPETDLAICDACRSLSRERATRSDILSLVIAWIENDGEYAAAWPRAWQIPQFGVVKQGAEEHRVSPPYIECAMHFKGLAAPQSRIGPQFLCAVLKEPSLAVCTQIPLVLQGLIKHR
jgi:hypothetical protein